MLNSNKNVNLYPFELLKDQINLNSFFAYLRVKRDCVMRCKWIHAL